ncbi:MAG: 16S rRNA (guanine(966)-N(2))-methyltransferase RsmD [Candidatus Dojkabacteria bacterium]
MLSIDEVLTMTIENMKTNQPRITTGTLKGRKLKVPESARPFTERVKISMFDLISEYIKDAKVLDLFAGSGNLGIEALSRGASYVQFVENDEKSIKVIRENLIGLDLQNQTRVTNLDVFKFLKINKDKFDIIFIDPPFSMDFIMRFEELEKSLTENGIIVLKLEEGNDKYKVQDLEIVYTKKIGSNVLYFLKRV